MFQTDVVVLCGKEYNMDISMKSTSFYFASLELENLELFLHYQEV